MGDGGLTSRTRIAILVAVALLALSPVSPLQTTEQQPEKSVADVSVVQPTEESSALLWPYTSRSRSFDRATLPMNAVVTADAETTYRLLRASPDQQRRLYWDNASGQWQTGQAERGNVTVNGTGVYWGDSAGSERYTFTMSDGSGRWADATYQLHDGTYFGSRYHLRLYESGSESAEWTAVQAHREHWDWFSLSHEVTSLSRAQHYLERDFRGTGLVADMRRERWGNGGALDADGWVTVIEPRHPLVRGAGVSSSSGSITPALVPLAVLGLAAATSVRRLRDEWWTVRERVRDGPLTTDHVALAGLTAAIPLVVRFGAIAAEQQFPATSPKVVGAPFYLLLVAGLPAVALYFGRRLDATDGFLLGVAGFGTGIMLDYSVLGLAVVPFDALVQRIVLLVGLGLLAAGGRERGAEPVPRYSFRTIGLATWVLALAWPLLGL